nr:MAG TPA: hypothetical protein [Caudoviricetes sp.]
MVGGGLFLLRSTPFHAILVHIISLSFAYQMKGWMPDD